MYRAPTAAVLLDNYAEFSSTYGNKRLTPTIRPHERTKLTPEARRRQADRWGLREDLRHITTKARIHGCGIHRIDGNGSVKLKGHHETGSTFLTGVQRCGYAQFCPVCAAKIAAVRSAEIAQATEQALAQGWGILHLTLTVSHGRHNTLQEMRDLLSPAWAAVTSGRGWIQDRDRYNVVGYIRAWDDTWGETNGWHPHFHVLLFTETPLTTAERDTLHQRIFARWQRFVVSQGYKEPSTEATRLDPITSQRGIGRYLNKLSLTIGNEMTRSDLKKAKQGGSLNHWQILKGLSETADADLFDLWMEWEAVMGGVQLVRWSNGLKQQFAIADLTDKQIAEQQESHTWERVLSEYEWELLSAQRHHIPLLLSCTRTHGPEAVDAFFSWIATTVHGPPDVVSS